MGYSLGRYFDPDLDLMGASACEGRIVNELPLIGHFIFGATSAYGSTFRRFHRSWVTHLPFVSTLIRLIFVGMVPFLICENFAINLIGQGWHMFWVGVWLGLSQADGIHWFLDMKWKD